MRLANRRRALAALLAACTCGAASASAVTTTSAAPLAAATADAGSITLYSGQHEQTVGKLVTDFEKRTGIDVKVRSADEATLANQIIQEGSRSPADVFFAENPPALQALVERKLLATLPASTLAAVPRKDSSPAGSWVAVSARAAVLAYNTDDVKAGALPASLLDLAKPEWKGRVGIAPGETDFQPLITAISHLKGPAAALAWIKGIKTNAKVYDDNEVLIAAVNKGSVATGLVDHYYWYRLRDEVGKGSTHSALHYFPAHDPGLLVDVSGAAILRSSKHSSEARQFLAYLVSKPAQTIIATSESYEYPLAAGVVNHKVARPLASLVPARVTAAQLGDGKAALALLQKVGLL
jgi:iron(III) transport system substrate-binding protein